MTICSVYCAAPSWFGHVCTCCESEELFTTRWQHFRMNSKNILLVDSKSGIKKKLVSNTHGMLRKIRLQKPNSTRKFICSKLCPLQFWWLKFQPHVISLISCQPARWNHSPHLSVDLSPRKFPTCNVPKEGPATTASEKTLAPPWAGRCEPVFPPTLWQIWKLLDLFNPF